MNWLLLEAGRWLATAALWPLLAGCAGDDDAMAGPLVVDAGTGPDVQAFCLELTMATCNRYQQCELFLQRISPATAPAYFDDCFDVVSADCPQVRALGARFEDCLEDVPSSRCELHLPSDTLELDFPTSCTGVLRK